MCNVVGAAVRQHPAPGHDPLETMTQEDYKHPIAPPPELWSHWYEVSRGDVAKLATRAAQWGADQELEACCADIRTVYGRTIADWLRSLRRPKPPSLKQQALDALGGMPIEPCLINGVDANASVRAKYNIIRQALEQLDD